MHQGQGKIALGFDHAADRTLLADFLSGVGFEVVECAPPFAASTSDLYLVDAQFARRYGDQIVVLKKASDRILLPLLIALPAGKSSRNWLEMGFDDCLSMPFTHKELKARVEAYLAQRQQSIERARRSESVFRSLVESSADHIFMLSADGIYLSSNDRVDQLGFRDGAELLGQALDEIYPPEIAALYAAKAKAVLETGEKISFEYHLSVAHAMRFYIVTLYPIQYRKTEVRVGGICRDITDRATAENERKLLAAAVGNTQEIILITDADGKLLYVNESAERVTEYTRRELLGENPRILQSGQHDRRFYKNLWETITAGQTWKGYLVNRRRSGNTYEVEATISPILDKSGRTTHYVSVQRDVTRERKLERQIQQTQRLEAIGTLAGGIAHDFNNILSPIIGYTDLSLGIVSPGGELAANLQEINKAASRAKELVRQILTFCRQTSREQKLLDVTPVLKEALKLLRATIPANIEIRQRLESKPFTIVADPTQIHQIILNLCTNAYHAMEKNGGVLTVQLKSVQLDELTAAGWHNLKPGPHLKLTVRDTGSGIPPQIIDKIFDPYFTTKAEQKGSGLGLSVVHGIVSSYGGAVTVYSEPGEGTEFAVYLPAMVAKAETESEKKRVVPGGTERILYVDDDPAIAELGRKVLARKGYRVTACDDALRALELLQTQDYDLVISDVTMPRMTGDKLASEIRRIRPNLPIILCTGYSEHVDAEHARTIGVKKFLMKPISPIELFAVVRELLDSTGD